jgi:hypothetical protein
MNRFTHVASYYNENENGLVFREFVFENSKTEKKGLWSNSIILTGVALDSSMTYKQKITLLEQQERSNLQIKEAEKTFNPTPTDMGCWPMQEHSESYEPKLMDVKNYNELDMHLMSEGARGGEAAASARGGEAAAGARGGEAAASAGARGGVPAASAGARGGVPAASAGARGGVPAEPSLHSQNSKAFWVSKRSSTNDAFSSNNRIIVIEAIGDSNYTEYTEASSKYTYVASYYKLGETIAKGVLFFNIEDVTQEKGVFSYSSIIIPGILLKPSMSQDEIQAMFNEPAVTVNIRIQEIGVGFQKPQDPKYNVSRPHSSQHGSVLQPIPLGTFDDLRAYIERVKPRHLGQSYRVPVA